MSGQNPALAERMQHIGLSPTMKGTIAAEKMRREGIDVVDLGAGEPDFPTPAHVTAAAHKALDANFTSTPPTWARSNSARPSASATARPTACRTRRTK
jgi:aspartate aminotransferase